MNLFRKSVASTAVAIMLSTGIAIAQGPPPHDNNQYVRHDEWHKGAKIAPNDWQRATPVDYHQRHLSAPPRGYEWRQVDGNYVLAAAATGIIASAIVASTVR